MAIRTVKRTKFLKGATKLNMQRGGAMSIYAARSYGPRRSNAVKDRGGR
jgi:hypothetical protein